MPTLNLTTNVQLPDPKAFALEFSKLAAELLRKPEAYMSVSYTYNETLTFAGTFDPAFQLLVLSLDNITPALTLEYSKVLFKYFEEKLGVAGDRAYIAYIDPGRPNIGFKGTTFAELWGSK